MTPLICSLAAIFLLANPGHPPADEPIYIESALVMQGESVMVTLAPQLGCSLSAPCSADIRIVFVGKDGAADENEVAIHELEGTSFVVTTIQVPFSGIVIAISDSPLLIRIIDPAPTRVLPDR